MATTMYLLMNALFAQGALSLAAIEDQKSAVQSAVNEITETQRSVNRQLEDAIKDADSERIQCIRSAKQSIDQLELIVSDANKKFLANISTSNFERSGVDFRQIIVSQSAVRQLAAQAETCFGEETANEQTSQVQVDVSALSQVPAEETDAAPNVFNLESESIPPPPDSSTFQN